ncbi:NHL domain-containing protein [Euphorbia peplus]|nr:NHL domain-containing protein [Euphorbia peplus]
MRRSHLPLASLLLFLVLAFQVHSAPSGPLIKHISTLLKWTATRSSSKTPQSEADYLQFEEGYLVETVVEGNQIGVVPHQIRVSEDGELYAVDQLKSNIVKITPPLSQYSRARLVAGSFQGYTGHVDGKSNEARFNHPKGVTMDDKGNVYVADTLNLAIRKIGDSGVTTIAGGKSNVAGYRDGPSEDAKFSNDFDVVYVHSTCSLLVVDRGNAALRQIALNQEDCDYQSSSITVTDLLMVVGAVLAGYLTCLLQQGFGHSFFSKTRLYPESDFKQHPSMEKPTHMMENMKEEPRWPTFGQLVIDLSKLALEALGSVFLYFMPAGFISNGPKKGLTPLKDSLRMPEDEVEPPPLVQRQTVPVALSETRKVHTPNPTDNYSEMKPPKMKSGSFRDPSLSSKHRSSKRQEYAEFYASGEVPTTGRSKSHKEKTRHRQRDKSGEVIRIKTASTELSVRNRYEVSSKFSSAMLPE